MDSHDGSNRFRSGQQRGGNSSVASETDRELRVVLTEHRPELSCAHCTGSSPLRPGKEKGVLHPPRFGVKYAQCAPIADLDQFTEPFAAPPPPAAVDPPEDCAPNDPMALPATL